MSLDSWPKGLASTGYIRAPHVAPGQMLGTAKGGKVQVSNRRIRTQDGALAPAPGEREGKRQASSAREPECVSFFLI